MEELWIDHTSFSQMTTAEECPYAYYLQRIAGVETVENAFAQAGTLAHQLLAKWARGEIRKEDLPVLWIQCFAKSVTADFPTFLASKGYKAKLFDAVFTYLETFEGFPGYEIVGAEKEFTSMIGGERFVGIIDLILRDKITSEITIVDYKCCSLSSFKKNRNKMYYQLLLYSKFCNDQFGRPPAKLRFELIKENTFDEQLYDPEDYVSARIWAESVIEEMKTKEMTDWFQTKAEYFKCVNLCSCRNECKFGKPENHKRKGDFCGTKHYATVA